jgi:hypothetical protein
VKTLILTIALSAVSGSALAGRIVVNHDEWTVSNSGYANAGAANVDRFAKNLAAFLAGGGTGAILIASSNFGLTDALHLGSLGAWTVTVNSAATLDAATLSGFDAVYLAGAASYPTAPEVTALINYVNGGGGVYIAAGTGDLGAVGEAGAWSSFLGPFGLQLDTVYNGIGGTIASTGASYAHPIFAGVAQLFYSNGQTVFDTLPLDPAQELYGPGYFGIYDDVVATPAPPLLALFGLGALALGLQRLTGGRRGRARPGA